jgi:hypothetical protein
MDGEGNPRKTRRRRRSASFANRNLIIDVKRKRLHWRSFAFQNFAVSRKDEMILEAATNVCVSPFGLDREFFSRSCFDSKK